MSARINHFLPTGAAAQRRQTQPIIGAPIIILTPPICNDGDDDVGANSRLHNRTCSINMAYAVSYIYHIIQRKMFCQDRSCSRINIKIVLFPTLLHPSRHSSPPYCSLTSYGRTHQHFGFGITFSVQLSCILQAKEKSLRNRQKGNLM